MDRPSIPIFSTADSDEGASCGVIGWIFDKRQSEL
jgi:hypothetical protein